MASQSRIQSELRRAAMYRMFADETPVTVDERAEIPEVPEALLKFVSGFRIKKRIPSVVEVTEKDEGGSNLRRLVQRVDVAVPVFDPMGSFKMGWDTGMVFVIIATVMLTPFQLAFVPEERCVNVWGDALEIVSISLDGLLLLDCVVTFRTAVYIGNELSMDRRKIAVRYLKGWFALDFLASIPFNHIIYYMDGGCRGENNRKTLGDFVILFKIVKVLKTVRLLRIFRLMKLMKTMDQWSSNPNSGASDYIRFGRLLIFISVLAHLAACALMYLAHVERPNVLDSRRRNWVTEWTATKCFSPLNRNFDDSSSQCAEPSTMRLYMAALYFSVTTLTTVGYGDIAPFSTQEMAWSIVVQFIGTCSLGYIMGEVTSIITQEDKSTNLIREKIAAINAYMRYRRLPHSLRVRVREHYSHMWKQTTIWDEPQILTEMSGILRAEVMQYINNEKLRNMRFTADLGRDFGDETMAQLSLRLTPQMASRGEPIIKEHQFGNETYILSSGLAEVLFHDTNIAAVLECEPDVVVRSLRFGDYFADYTLFLEHEAKHPFTVQAVVPCEMFALTRDAVKKIVQHFPAAAASFDALHNTRYNDMMNILSDPKNIMLVARAQPPPVAARTMRPLRSLAKGCRKRPNFLSSRARPSAAKVYTTTSHTTKPARASTFAQVPYLDLSPQLLVRTKLWSKRAVLAHLRSVSLTVDGFPIDDNAQRRPSLPAARSRDHCELVDTTAPNTRRRRQSRRAQSDLRDTVDALSASIAAMQQQMRGFDDLRDVLRRLVAHEEHEVHH